MSASTCNAARARNGCAAEAGYTLLEFLVAFTMLVVVMAALLAALSGAVRSDRQAGFLTLATLLAKSKLAAAGVDFPLRPGSTAARFDNGYGWRATVRPYGTAVAAGGLSVEALWVDVTVFDPRGGNRSHTLSSLEIVPRRGL